MFSFLTGFKITDWLKVIAVLAVLIAVGGTVYGGYRYVVNLQTEVSRLNSANATLEANNAQLEQGITEQQRTIATLRDDFARQAAILRQNNTEFQEARDRVTALEEKLSEHELGFLAANKPKLIENIINRASDNASRCFEIATGAPLTAAEKAATLPSQINTECPDLANPNYKAK